VPEAPVGRRLDQPRVGRRRFEVDPDGFARLSERIARFLGTGRFLAIQSVIVVFWIALNLIAWQIQWDPYPFILLNLAFSTQAAYAAPLILLAQNRQDDRDRIALDEDRRRAERTKADTEFLARELAALRLEVGETARGGRPPAPPRLPPRGAGEAHRPARRRGRPGGRGHRPGPARGEGRPQAGPQEGPVQGMSLRLIRSRSARSAGSSRSAKCSRTPRRCVVAAIRRRS
jgi:uncharacterized membrane protein